MLKIYWGVRIKLFMVLLFLFSPELRAEDCQPEEVRLDSPGGPLEDHRTEDQDDLSICYATNASVVLQAALPEHEQVSYLHLAFQNTKANAPFVKSSDGEDFFSFDGGNVCQSFVKAQKEGVCAAAQVPLESAALTGQAMPDTQADTLSAIGHLLVKMQTNDDFSSEWQQVYSADGFMDQAAAEGKCSSPSTTQGKALLDECTRAQMQVPSNRSWYGCEKQKLQQPYIEAQRTILLATADEKKERLSLADEYKFKDFTEEEFFKKLKRCGEEFTTMEAIRKVWPSGFKDPKCKMLYMSWNSYNDKVAKIERAQAEIEKINTTCSLEEAATEEINKDNAKFGAIDDSGALVYTAEGQKIVDSILKTYGTKLQSESKRLNRPLSEREAREALLSAAQENRAPKWLEDKISNQYYRSGLVGDAGWSHEPTCREAAIIFRLFDPGVARQTLERATGCTVSDDVGFMLSAVGSSLPSQAVDVAEVLRSLEHLPEDPEAMFLGSLAPTCAAGKKLKVASSLKCEYENFTSRYGTEKKRNVALFREDVRKDIKETKIPLSIGICSQMMYDPSENTRNGMVSGSAQKPCELKSDPLSGTHGLPIIGYRVIPVTDAAGVTQCTYQYLVQNSWGASSCHGDYQTKGLCEKGKIWLPEETVLNNSFSVERVTR